MTALDAAAKVDMTTEVKLDSEKVLSAVEFSPGLIPGWTLAKAPEWSGSRLTSSRSRSLTGYCESKSSERNYSGLTLTGLVTVPGRFVDYFPSFLPSAINFCLCASCSSTSFGGHARDSHSRRSHGSVASSLGSHISGRSSG